MRDPPVCDSQPAPRPVSAHPQRRCSTLMTGYIYQTVSSYMHPTIRLSHRLGRGAGVRCAVSVGRPGPPYQSYSAGFLRDYSFSPTNLTVCEAGSSCTVHFQSHKPTVRLQHRRQRCNTLRTKVRFCPAGLTELNSRNNTHTDATTNINGSLSAKCLTHPRRQDSSGCDSRKVPSTRLSCQPQKVDILHRSHKEKYRVE
jgi:hypothetical protein